MKKTLVILLATIVALSIQTKAQTDVSKTLEANTKYLSSYDMKGRGHGSKQAEQTREFIKENMQGLGLQCVGYNLSSKDVKRIQDSIGEYRNKIERLLQNNKSKQDSEKKDIGSYLQIREDKLYENFYVTIKAKSQSTRKGCLLIEIPYNGYGVDTLQQKELVNYSVNGAGKVALAIEMAKYFQQQADSLSRDIIILFVDDIETNDIGDVFRFENKEKDIKILFSFGNVTEDCYKTVEQDDSWWSYTMPYNIVNAGRLLAPMLIKDVENNTQADYDGKTAYRAFIAYNYGEYDAEHYANIIDSLDFNVFERNLSFFEKVIMLFDNSELAMKAVKTSDGQMIEDDNYEKDFYITEDVPEALQDYKHRNYWGMNAMIGSNQHHYTKGRVTGKNTTAFMVGLFAHLEFAKYNAIRVGVNYERANANRKDGWYQSNVLSIPLNYELSTGGKRFAEFSIAIGPYFDYTFSGELNKKDLDFDNEFRNYEFGLNLQLLVRTRRFIIGWYTKNGLTNIMHHNPEILERASYFMIGWRF